MGRRFRQWAIAIAGTLVLIAVHAAWDLVEARRLLRVLADTTAATSAPQPVRPQPSRDAARFYLAAAELAERDMADRLRADVNTQLRTASASADLAPETLTALRSLVAFHAEAFHLLDRATSLEFKGFPLTVRAEVMQLRPLEWLAGVRTVQAAIDGQADLAAASLVAELKLDGGPGRPMTPLWPFIVARRTESVRNAQIVLRRTQPSEAALAGLADAIADADYDEEWGDFFARERDEVLERARAPWAYGARSGQVGLLSAGGPSWFKLWRPLSAREVRRLLTRYQELIAASRGPWPDRIERVMDVTGPPRSAFAQGYVTFLTSASSWLIHVDPELQRRQLYFSALDLAGIRAVRVAVAIERHRRAHAGVPPATLEALVPVYLGALPIDPFTGSPMRYRADRAEYVVYSVGVDRQDAGGEQAEASPWTPGPSGSIVRSTGDIGIRVPVQRRDPNSAISQ